MNDMATSRSCGFRGGRSPKVIFNGISGTTVAAAGMGGQEQNEVDKRLFTIVCRSTGCPQLF